MREHQAQQAIYDQRNSYSKTDHDATFMRVKEDSMQNGQLKPATTFKSPRVISSLRDIGFSKIQPTHEPYNRLLNI
ncbi:Mobile element protein [Lactiplantibacillus plantarum]|nr:Mobile element protein [Lactiplantibacillus plantarum]